MILRKDSAYASLAELPAGSVVGTSSVRRAAQLSARFPHVTLKDVRGNLNTRLRKLDADGGEYAALILAVAGVERMGWKDRISEVNIQCISNSFFALIHNRSLSPLLPSRKSCSSSRNTAPSLETLTVMFV